jgi:hypothetical protein
MSFLGPDVEITHRVVALPEQIAVNRSEIKVKTSDARIARSQNFVNNWIGPSHVFASIITSGV